MNGPIKLCSRCDNTLWWSNFILGFYSSFVIFKYLQQYGEGLQRCKQQNFAFREQKVIALTIWKSEF